MKRRCPSAKMTSKASDDLPEPDGPVTTTSLPSGTSVETPLSVCSRACSMWIASTAGARAAPFAP